jgi:ribose 5-phosphate isomerase A
VANPKEAAGRAAAELVEDGMRLGLGTGSTVHFTLLRLAERMREEKLRIVGVPTSIDTERKALELGLALGTLEQIDRFDLAIDGADEVDPAFAMVKGGGGALLREKVVASLASRVAIVVGEDKLVSRLAQRFPLPIEVVPFALAPVRRSLRGLGAVPALRVKEGGAVYTTDNHNWVLDCLFADGVTDPRATEASIQALPGVVACGLFNGLAHILLVGKADGTVERRDAPAR